MLQKINKLDTSPSFRPESFPKLQIFVEIVDTLILRPFQLKFLNESFYNMRCVVMFITAVCLIFLFVEMFRRNIQSPVWKPRRKGGGGNSHIEQTGMLVGNFEFNPKRRPIWVWLKEILTPKRDRLKTHKYDMQWVLMIYRHYHRMLLKFLKELS